MSDMYAWYKSHGICTYCRQADAVRGKVLCPDCAELRHEQHRIYYQQHETEIRAKHKTWSKIRYEQRKAAGVCVRCGKRPPQSGKFSCTRCIAKQARYKADAFQRKGGTPRWLAADLGLCYLCCKQPKLPDKKVCRTCYKKICDVNREKANGGNGHGNSERGREAGYTEAVPLL